MVYIIVALIFYTLAILASTYANRNSDVTFVTAIVHTLAAVAPVALLAPHFSKLDTLFNKQGLFFSLLAGVCIGIFGLAIGKAYAVNKVGIVVPIVFGGSIFLSTTLSYFLFGEKVGTVQSVGLTFIFVGLLLVIYTRMHAI